MKSKISITLDNGTRQRIENHRADFRNRSEFIEAAVQHYIGHLERDEADRRDLQIINENADRLNAEAEDVLGYQAPI